MPARARSYLPGIDVSHYQGAVDWRAVAASGVRFAFIKATDGVDDVDPLFQQNWAGAGAATILRSAYHFFRPGLDAKRQAERFLGVLAMDDLAIAPALDVEVTDGLDPAALQQGIRCWLDEVAAALGRPPIVYTDPMFWRANVGGDFGAYPFWLACYADQPEVPAAWRGWTFWQHSDVGRVPGIVGHVDLDCCALSYEDLRSGRLFGSDS